MFPTPDLSVTLVTGTKVPVFAQICDAVRAQVTDGTLPPGSRLPTTRALAAELGVAVNTVAKAYRELENEGFIEGRGRLGTFVVDRSGAVGDREARRFIQAMRNLGLSRDEVVELIHRVW